MLISHPQASAGGTKVSLFGITGISRATFLALVVFIFTLAANPGKAATVFENSWNVATLNASARAWNSNGGNLLVYDRFSLSEAAELTSLTWVARTYATGNVFVEIYDTTRTSLLFNSLFAASAIRNTVIPGQASDGAVHERYLEISSWSIAAGDYWIGIQGTESILNTNALVGMGQSGSLIQVVSGTDNSRNQTGAFRLEGNAPVSVVPLPAGLPLLAGGLGLLGMIFGRRRKPVRKP